MATAVASPTRARRGIALLAWLVLAWNVLVVVWGALVRSTGSGAGCGNHWPLCNGQVIPVAPSTHTLIEFIHRMMTGGASLLLIALVVATLMRVPRQHPARKAVLYSVLFLVLEALLGALLVKLGYVTDNRSTGRVVMLSVHLTNTLLLLASLTLTAWLLSGNAVPRLRAKHWIVIVSTIVVGVSGSLAALGDTLFPANSLRAAFAQDFAADSPVLLRLRSVHPISVFIATAALLWLLLTLRSRARTHTFATATVCLLVFQIGLGIADLALLAPWWMQLLHLFGADLFWIALLTLTFRDAETRDAEPA